MITVLFMIVLFLTLMALAGYLWWRERRYLRKKTSEAMSERVWKEVETERGDALRKRRLFHEALKKAKP